MHMLPIIKVIIHHKQHAFEQFITFIGMLTSNLFLHGVHVDDASEPGWLDAAIGESGAKPALLGCKLN